tara:strand:+ start:974 stop:1720 length:747 start_codon:yes stop_codon:yes gene_type:complete
MLNASKKAEKKVIYIFAMALIINVVFWLYSRNLQAEWSNVPPAPNKKYAALYGLGDSQFAYRIIGIMIQNMGDSGGRVTALKDYKYETLTDWFYVEDYLDSTSNYIPYLAAYYFSSLQEPERFRPVLSYLREIGLRTEDEKWRFLLQAVVVARKNMKDHETALELAKELANHKKEDIPIFTKQIPSFVLREKGDKELAYTVMVEILKSSAEKLQPQEVNQMLAHICNQILSEEEAQKDPLCDNVPKYK